MPRTIIPAAAIGLPKNRQHIEDTIEQLIAVLDAIDGDCDLEPQGDEEVEPEEDIGWLMMNYAGPLSPVIGRRSA